MLTVTPDIILRTGYDILDHAHVRDLHTEPLEVKRDVENMMNTARGRTHEHSISDTKMRKDPSTVREESDIRRGRVHMLQVVAEADHLTIDLKIIEMVVRNTRTSQ